MITAAELLTDPELPLRLKVLLGHVPKHRLKTLIFEGYFHCESGVKGIILRDKERFIVCAKGTETRCAESPSVFAALDEASMCNRLWREI